MAARYASLAYCLDDSNSHKLAPGFFGRIEELEADNTQTINIFFKVPTLEQIGWFSSNFQLEKIKKDGASDMQIGSVFKNEMDHVKPFWNILQPEIAKLATKNMKRTTTTTKINFIGHENAGVMAFLSAMSLSTGDTNYFCRVFHICEFRAISFGAPRIGDENFANKVNQLTNSDKQKLRLQKKIPFHFIRVTQAYDPIPRLPLQSASGLIYKHAGEEFWIPPDSECNCLSDDTIFYCPGKVVDPSKGDIEENLACINQYKASINPKSQKSNFNNIQYYFSHQMGLQNNDECQNFF
ncbi:hypothetical protein G9A89_008933 [Geosiphon pyriformis]|nr:hypothetical protein G9A89_008933 [Geosiphon pyriformis]